MKILITGATGFVGYNLLKELLKDGHEITVVASTHSENDIPREVKDVCYLGLEGLDWNKTKEKDAIIHQAANNDTLYQNKDEMHRANVSGPIKLFQEAAKRGCKKFVYASSTATYGNENAPYIEDKTPISPINVYGESKALFDEFAMDFAKRMNVEVIGFKYCNVYGPGEKHKGKRASMIYQIIQQLLKNRRVKLFKDGTQKRDWIYIEDVVQANMKALYSKNKTGIYNCGTGTATNFNDLVKIISYELNLPLNHLIEYIDNPNETAYQSHTECDITKLREELNFFPQFDIKSGIKKYLKELNTI